MTVSIMLTLAKNAPQNHIQLGEQELSLFIELFENPIKNVHGPLVQEDIINQFFSRELVLVPPTVST